MRLGKILIGAVIIMMTAPFAFAQLQVPDKDRSGNLTLKKNIERSFPSTELKLKESEETSSADTVPRSKRKFRMKKSPTLAVLLSAVVPGAGQLYNGSYWKIPIIAGLTGYFGYEYIYNNNKFKDYRDQYNATITAEDPFGNLNLKTLREFYRNQRDDFVWYFLIVYVVNLVDAYVDAHLFDFDVKEEKLMRFGKTDHEIKLKVRYNF